MMRRLLFVSLPLMVGLGLALAFAEGVFTNRVLLIQYSFDFSGLSLRMGILGSVITASAVMAWRAYQNHMAWVIDETTQAHHKTHRRFLGRLDHELKNPLTIMRLGTINLLENESLPAEVKASTERIALQVRRVEQLVVDLRWLVELDEREIERQKLTIPKLLDSAISASRVEYPDHTIECTTQTIPWAVGDVLGDADLLQIAFSNLLNNALKFTQPDGKIQVSVSDNGKACLIEIADSGMGIPTADQPFIFQELYRGSNARRISGGGMGLALVERIIALHGGSIEVRSREGHGTVFTVQLPLANPGGVA